MMHKCRRIKIKLPKRLNNYKLCKNNSQTIPLLPYLIIRKSKNILVHDCLKVIFGNNAHVGVIRLGKC